MEHFDAGDLVGCVVVEDDSGGDFLGFDDGGVVEAEVEGVGFLVDVEFHGFGGLVRSHEFTYLTGCDLVLNLAGGYFFEENFLECFRVVHAPGGVEDFDAGEMVHIDDS